MSFPVFDKRPAQHCQPNVSTWRCHCSVLLSDCGAEGFPGCPSVFPEFPEVFCGSGLMRALYFV